MPNLTWMCQDCGILTEAGILDCPRCKGPWCSEHKCCVCEKVISVSSLLGWCDSCWEQERLEAVEFERVKKETEKRLQKLRDKGDYRGYKKENCEKCGLQALHPSQLEVDHIDGNHFNNSPVNLQTLCANCHRLKTHDAIFFERCNFSSVFKYDFKEEPKRK